MVDTPKPTPPPPPTSKKVSHKKPRNWAYKKWPKLTDAEQRLILRFLTAYQEQASLAADKASQMFSLSGCDPSFAPMMHYWQACVKCINWLAQRTTVRQEYLTLPDPTQEGEPPCPVSENPK